MPDPRRALIGLGSLLRRTVRSLLGRETVERDLDDEIRFHLEMEAAGHRDRGLEPAEADRRAARAFGSALRVREESGDARRLIALENFGRDIGFGIRALRKTPGVTIAAVLSLALGIGASTTMFSITNGILRDLPVSRPERLIHVAGVNRRTGAATLGLTAGEIESIRTQQRSIEAIGAVDNETFYLGDETRWAERWDGARIDPEVFGILGVHPTLGREFSRSDQTTGALPVAILSDRVWRQRYDGSPSAIGRMIRIGGVPHQVIGVMPPGFRFPVREEVWLPRRIDQTAGLAEGHRWMAIARLRDGVSLESSHAELSAIGARLASSNPATHRDFGIRARPYRDQTVQPSKRGIFYAMVGVVSFLLAMACVNVANLLVARAAARNREMAVRAAVGATRSRIAVQIGAEVLLMTAAGGIVGVLMAWAGVVVFNRLMLPDLSYWMRVEVDLVVLGYAALLVLGSAALASLAPARQAGRVDLARVLGESGRTATGFRLGRLARGLVGFEVALSTVLLVVTALMIDGTRKLARPDLAIDPSRIAAATVSIPAGGPATGAERGRYYRAILERVGAVPGVTGAVLATTLPGFGAPSFPLEIEGVTLDSTARPLVTASATMAGYVTFFGRTVLEGRDLNPSDDIGSPPVALVDRRVVDRHFGGISPIGRRIRLGADSAWITIVGVVPVLGIQAFEEPDRPAVYRPLAQTASADLTIAASTSGPAAAVVPAIRSALAGVDRDVAQLDAGALDRLLHQSRGPETVFSRLFLIFGVIALGMAALGLASLAAFAVRQRTREIAVRVALGAVRRDVLRLVMRGGLGQLIVGLGLGLGLATLTTPLFGDALMGGDRRDWRVYAAIAVTLGAIGTVALWLPARRALRLSPTEVFRQE